ncbi:MAG: redoxin domain-containing protein, partial [Planctomycetota bacterium]
PDGSLSTKEKNELSFHVLSDRGNRVAQQFGIAYILPPELKSRFGERLAGFNGDDSATLPLAATFVVDRDGVVRWSFIEDDYRVRAEPDDILAALEAL